MKRLRRIILESSIKLYEEKRRPFTRDDLVLKVYNRLRRDGSSYSLSTIQREISVLAALGFFNVLYREERRTVNRGVLRWRRAYIHPKVNTIKAYLRGVGGREPQGH